MKLSIVAPSLALLAPALPTALAWGGFGHMTVAFVAENFVQAHTKTFFQTLLGDTSPAYLANVATWADSFRYTKDGKFSEPFHFIDANDNPPHSCGVTFTRDCSGKGGCVISAIQNYTTRVLSPKVSPAERKIAAKFLVHFVGDIHQPLHDENLDKGGNGIQVTYAGKPTNLHAVWDTNIPEAIVGGGYKMDDAHKWAASLTADIKTGAYKSVAAGWLKGMKLADPVATSLVWASEANAYVCTTVIPAGAAALEGIDLSGDYFKTAAPVVKLQIARAGYRLAAWLDLIASNAKAQDL